MLELGWQCPGRRWADLGWASSELGLLSGFSTCYRYKRLNCATGLLIGFQCHGSVPPGWCSGYMPADDKPDWNSVLKGLFDTSGRAICYIFLEPWKLHNPILNHIFLIFFKIQNFILRLRTRVDEWLILLKHCSSWAPRLGIRSGSPVGERTIDTSIAQGGRVSFGRDDSVSSHRSTPCWFMRCTRWDAVKCLPLIHVCVNSTCELCSDEAWWRRAHACLHSS